MYRRRLLYSVLSSPLRPYSAVTPSAQLLARRQVHYVTTAADFDASVIQSQQAVCLVYHVPRSSNCAAFLRTAEQIVDRINAETSCASAPVVVVSDENTPDKNVEASKPLASSSWLKLCTINADENRNLASAFSVERAKVPVTFFIMQGTIIDRVTGHIPAARLEGILMKFLEHYQKELNVDLMYRRNMENVNSHGTSSPLPSAAPADLLSGVSTAFITEKIMMSLASPERIQLPEESEQLDGLRQTIRQAKQTAHDELMHLHRTLGLDVRRLTDAEKYTHYYRSSEFISLGLLSALEALYLARTYAFLGDISRSVVDGAKHSIQHDFEPILGDPQIRRVLALVDANLLRKDLIILEHESQRHMQRLGVHDPEEVGDEMKHNNPIAIHLLDQIRYTKEMVRIIDEYVDCRAVVDAFPSTVIESLFVELKESIKRSKGPMIILPVAESDDTATGESKNVFAVRVEHVRTLILCILQLFAADPQSNAARSRLSSLLY